MSFLKKQYHEAFTTLRGPVWPFLRNAVIAFVVIYVIFAAASLFSPAIHALLIQQIEAVMENADIVKDDGSISALRILINNARAAGFSILYGIFPFLYLPALAIGINAAVLGGLTASYAASPHTLLLLAAGILPHGIFEIPALWIAFGCGLYLCHDLTSRIRNRPRPTSFSVLFFSLLRVYLAVIFPLLIAASLVEAYITPWCMAFFA